MPSLNRVQLIYVSKFVVILNLMLSMLHLIGSILKIVISPLLVQSDGSILRLAD